MSARDNSKSGCSAKLPPDLLIEIFSCLPVKSTLKFRCVSKAWLSLLSDPLSQKYLPPAMSGFFYQLPLETSFSFSSVFPGKDQQLELSSIARSISRSTGGLKLWLLDCCNGLLLFQCSDKLSKKYSFIVCNPTGKTWAIIDMECNEIFGVTLIFDPKTSPHFKVVLITEIKFQRNGHTTLELLIFSSATNDCEVSTIDRELPAYMDSLRRFNIRTTYFREQVKTTELAIINSEDWPPKCQLVPLPGSSFPRDERMEILGESGGRVHYAVCRESNLLVWMLEEKGYWVSKHVTSMRNLIQGHKETRRRTPAGSIRPLAFHPDLDVVFLQLEWNIYACHPSSGSFELLVSRRGANPDELSYRLFPFKSCLIADPLASLATVRKIGF